MIFSPTSNGRSTECRRWSPPALLLAAEVDDQGLIADLIDAFSTDTAVRIRRIHEALAASNFSTIRAEAHTIRGSALEVGADAVAEACQELETMSALQEAAVIAAGLNR